MLLYSNPVAAVRMFQFWAEIFFAEYIMSSAKPLGDVKDYVIKIEFQVCVSPNAHCLLWVKRASHIDFDSDDDACICTAHFITGKIPLDTDNSQDVRDLSKIHKLMHTLHVADE